IPKGRIGGTPKPRVPVRPTKPAATAEASTGAPRAVSPPKPAARKTLPGPAAPNRPAVPKAAPAAAPMKSAPAAAPMKSAPAAAAAKVSPQPNAADALREARGREAKRLFALGAALHRQGRIADAVRAYGRAIVFDPVFADAYANLGAAFRAQGKSEAAVASAARALALQPDRANFHSNLGNALRDQGRLEEAAQALQQALRLAPDAPEILYNFGLVLRDMGRLDTALSCFDAVLKSRPDHAECRYDRALALLQAGDLKRGFAEYEARWKLRRNPPRAFEVARWNGQAMPGKTLLVHAEPGFGDAIQFARFAAHAKEKSGATVLLESPAELARLMETLQAVDKIAVQGGPLPAFDAHIPIMSLPALMGTVATTIPAAVPYLSAPEIRAVALPNLVAGAFKVGIVWAGAAAARAERHRSCPFVHFLELLRVPGVVLYSLQTGKAAEDARQHAAEPLVFETGHLLADYADMASAILQLDLVVSVDSTAAHLAGALGKPVWTLLPDVPDWRWTARGKNTPWYPTMRLFRQKTRGDWSGVIAEAVAELRAVAGKRPRSG
ncbi:MAG: tetratricopeptide repeat protein, partial [Myxococcales bacterium]